jgi:hypothetical protein
MYKILVFIKLGHFGGDAKATVMEVIEFSSKAEADSAVSRILAAKINDLSAIALC